MPVSCCHSFTILATVPAETHARHPARAPSPPSPKTTAVAQPLRLLPPACLTVPRCVARAVSSWPPRAGRRVDVGWLAGTESLRRPRAGIMDVSMLALVSPPWRAPKPAKEGHGRIAAELVRPLFARLSVFGGSRRPCASCGNGRRMEGEARGAEVASEGEPCGQDLAAWRMSPRGRSSVTLWREPLGPFAWWGWWVGGFGDGAVLVLAARSWLRLGGLGALESDILLVPDDC